MRPFAIVTLLALGLAHAAHALPARPDASPEPGPDAAAGEVVSVDEPLRTLAAYVDEVVGEYSGNAPRWAFEFDGVSMMLIADPAAGRMRIFAPISPAGALTAEEMLAMLEANFDRALDAKYSVWRGGVWSTYTHPLGPLSREQFTSALWQVAALHHTYGSTYSSTGSVFGGAGSRGE